MVRSDYHAWSGEELSLLLRAWAQESARAPKHLQSAVFQRFQTLCRDAGFTHSRADPSVVFKLNAMRNMHAVISAFLASSPDVTAHSDNTSALPQESDGSSGGGSGDGIGDGPLRAWLAMPKRERRRFFAAINRKSYLYTEITLEQFELIHSVLTKDGKQEFVLPGAYRDSLCALRSGEQPVTAAGGPRKVKRETKLALGPTSSIRGAIAAIQEASEQFEIVMKWFTTNRPYESHQLTLNSAPAAGTAAGLSAPPSPQRPESNSPVVQESGSCTAQTKVAPVEPGSRDLPAQVDGGSDTESEDEWDEIVPRSPVREEEVVVMSTSAEQEPTNFDKEHCGGTVADPGSERLKRSVSPTQPSYPEKRSRTVQPEVSILLNDLEQQTLALKDMLRKARAARYRDQMERKQILEHLRQEYNTRYEVLEDLQRQEAEIRQRRDEWWREQDELRREWADLSGGVVG